MDEEHAHEHRLKHKAYPPGERSALRTGPSGGRVDLEEPGYPIAAPGTKFAPRAFEVPRPDLEPQVIAGRRGIDSEPAWEDSRTDRGRDRTPDGHGDFNRPQMGDHAFRDDGHRHAGSGHQR